MAAGPIDKAADTFKTLIFDGLVKSAIAGILGLAPFLSFGPIAFIVSKAVTYFADKLYESLKEYINFEVISLKNAEHHKAYVAACVQLRNLARERGIDSVDYREAREKHKTALAAFVRYTGT